MSKCRLTPRFGILLSNIQVMLNKFMDSLSHKLHYLSVNLIKLLWRNKLQKKSSCSSRKKKRKKKLRTNMTLLFIL